eukprot:10920793-Alexandrium_andersonii.AAC.1
MEAPACSVFRKVRWGSPRLGGYSAIGLRKGRTATRISMSGIRYRWSAAASHSAERAHQQAARLH